MNDIERHGRRRRTRRVALIGVPAMVLMAVALVGTLAVAHDGGTRKQAAPPTTTGRVLHADGIDDIRPAVASARLTRRVLVDHGALELAPPTSMPKVAEATAIARFRAGTPPSTTVGDDVVVFAARVTVGSSVSTDNSRSRSLAATFRDRLAWVTLWSPGGGVFNCPNHTGPPPPRSAPASFSALLLSSDGEEGLEYATAGVKPCFQYAKHPTVTVGLVVVSLRWERVERAGGWTARYQVPPCGHFSLSETSNTSADDHPELTLYAESPLTRGPCPPPPVSYQPISGPPLHVDHGPVGQLPGRSNTAAGSLRYFDGEVRTDG